MQDNRNAGNMGLLLLGGLAALITSRDVRRGVVTGTHYLASESQKTLEESVKPALGEIAKLTQHNLEVLREQAPRALETAQELAGSATERAQHLLNNVDVDDVKKNLRHGLKDARSTGEDVLGQLQAQLEQWTGEAQERLQEARRDAEHARRDADKSLGRWRKQAEKEWRGKERQAATLLGSVTEGAQHWLGEQQHSFKREKRDAVRLLEQARRKAERELRAGRDWDRADLERAIEKRVAPLAKQTRKTLAKLDQQAERQYKALQKQRRAEASGGSLGMLLPLGLLAGGVVVLARVPSSRHSLISAAHKVSPDLADKLHQASRKARETFGDLWVEDTQPELVLTVQAESTQTETAEAKQ